MTAVEDQIYLLGWDGRQWSDPQAQPSVFGFEDPETFTQVTYRCRQPEFTNDDQILMVGCDGGEGRDIWFTSRPVGTVEDWFPPPSVWSEPTSIATSNSEITTPVLVADDQGRMHAFWSQVEEGDEIYGDTLIHYTRWDGESWSRPIAVLGLPSEIAGFSKGNCCEDI